MSDLFRAITRAIRFAWHLLRGLQQSSHLQRRYNSNWHQTEQGKQAIQAWLKQLCKILGLQVNARYRAADTPVMLVANHVSWLDIIAIGSLIPTRFLAKQEIRQWPLIGNLAKRGGTLFIRRDNRKSACEAKLKLADALSGNPLSGNPLPGNQRIMIFPEGTTTDGQTTTAFKPALFEASRIAQCDIQPVAIRYWRDNTLDMIAPYIEDDNFISHLWRIMRVPQTQVDLHFCLPIKSDIPRQQLAEFCRMVINTELKNNYPSETKNNTVTLSGLDQPVYAD